MPLWPFGGTKVESVSRVVSAVLADEHTVRGKLTIHFATSWAQSDADELGDRVAAIAEGILREQKSFENVIGEEARLTKDLVARYPRGTGETRGLELAALHVVGEVALSDAQRQKRSSQSSGSMPAVRPGSDPGTSRSSSPSRPSAPSRPSSPSTATGTGAGTTSRPPEQRRRSSSSSSMRAINTLLLPPGSPPPAIAAFVSPLVFETAQRFLIAALRAHDLLILRNVTLDERSAELLASLVTSGEAPPGGYDVGRAAEIARWRASIGASAVSALRKSMNAAAVYLAREEMVRADIPLPLGDDVAASLMSTFAEDKPDDLAISRYRLSRIDFVDELARAATDVLEGHAETDGMKAALAPLVGLAREDFSQASVVVKHAAKPPAP